MEPNYTHRTDTNPITDSDSSQNNDGIEVEAVLDRRDVSDRSAGKHSIEYLTKGVGYDAAHNHWVPKGNPHGGQAVLHELLGALAM